MTILLPALAATFAAFCVWLTVRIVNRRERWAKRTLALIIGLPVLYVASFGPACWATSRFDMIYPVFDTAYRPLIQAAERIPEMQSSLDWYATTGMPEPSLLCVPGTSPEDPRFWTSGSILLQIDPPQH